MSDLISRQAAIDVLKERLQANGYSNTALVSELNRSIWYLMRLSSAERRGRWDNGFCSVCGAEALTEWNDTGGEYAFTTFCPNCGAQMSPPDEE